MSLWLSHPRSGKQDTMLTVAVVSTIVILGKVLLNGVGIGDVSLGTIDSTLVAAVLTPTLGAYVLRKQKSPPDGERQHGKSKR